MLTYLLNKHWEIVFFLDETVFEKKKELYFEKEFDIEKESDVENESDVEMDEDMDFEAPSELQKFLPKPKENTQSDLVDFKVKTFENFANKLQKPKTDTLDSLINKSQKSKTDTFDSFINKSQWSKTDTFDSFINKSQKPKADTFNFFSGDTVKSSILKPEPQKEKFSFLSAPKTSLESSLTSTQPLFPSVNSFKTCETLASSKQIEAVPATKHESYKDTQSLAKNFSFKSPVASSKSSPFMKESFGTNSMSFFNKEIREETSTDRVHSFTNSFIPSSTSLEKNIATTASQIEVIYFIYSV